MIEGIKFKELIMHNDERGRLMEMLRNDDDAYTEFGQVYMTTNYPGIIKAWHCHEKQTDYVTCISGMIKLALYDGREESSTYRSVEELFIGDHKKRMVVIPPGVYHGWKNIGTDESIVVSVITRPYNADNPDEIRLPYDSDKIPYSWEVKMG
ncbi:MAG: dTDP-4-dehydrorhamnose 3,5-epimerase family protein [candidate division WOR-3 bacterium]|nr:dTDP-4-dehydrorhamnose 3,5-epimerase family protein [candidate division WOR-3 bacterium]